MHKTVLSRDFPLLPTVIVVVLVATFSASCGPATDDETPPARMAAETAVADNFGDYWYQGKAELTSYELEQARYGALHHGTAVTIFVTEDLSRRKQVKLDNPADAGDDAVKVLKLNSTRDFVTGIYPYSVMTSVFTPVYRDRNPHTLKVTNSVQEWCGQTFAQLNRKRDGYRLRSFSYFESDGDVEKSLPDVVLEDELWTLVRLNPDRLPVGELIVLPSSLHQRLSHDDWDAHRAVASRETAADGLVNYRLIYSGLDRELLIRFRSEFPHEIEYWEESHVSGFGPDAEKLTTRATLKRRILSDYWTRNRPDDVAMRELLAL